MMLPQIIWIIWMCMALGVAVARHGEPREKTWNFWALLQVVAMLAGLLYWGGFFDVWFK